MEVGFCAAVACAELCAETERDAAEHVDVGEAGCLSFSLSQELFYSRLSNWGIIVATDSYVTVLMKGLMDNLCVKDSTSEDAAGRWK